MVLQVEGALVDESDPLILLIDHEAVCVDSGEDEGLVAGHFVLKIGFNELLQILSVP